MIAGRLTMRAEVERNSASGTDAHNNPVAPVFAPHATLACFVWSKMSKELVGQDRTAMLEDMRAMFALGADIAEADEIARVTDRKGAEIIPGRLRVDGPVQRKHNHVEVALRRVS